jgi:hypothetical protein
MIGRLLSSKRWRFSKRNNSRNAGSSSKRWGAFLPMFELLEPRVVLAATPVISEFLASNDRVLVDEDGDDSDWVEIYNPGTEAISLRKWVLTDDPADLTKWRFPDVELDPREHLVVFASSKDRDTPGVPLHTNFKLDKDGGFLALVQPDGVTIASQFTYPGQIEDVSYGVPAGVRPTKVVTAGQLGKIFAPTNGLLDPREPDALGGTWLDPAFDDSSWNSVSTAVGYAAQFGTIPEATITNSSDDFTTDGQQGVQGWTSGYYAHSSDLDQTYPANNFTPFSADSWLLTKYDWPTGDPPFTEVGKSMVRPSGIDSGPIHWAIRRWTSDRNDNIAVTWDVSKSVVGGDGVTGRVYHNGVEVDSAQIAGTDRAGIKRTVHIANVKEGDHIDIALDPTGVGGTPATADGADDSSNLNAVMTRKAQYTIHFSTDVSSQVSGKTTGLYLRIPFRLDDISSVDWLKLKLKYDDGFAAYLNGQLIASGNAPEATRFDSAATADRDPIAATQFEEIDVSQGRRFLNVGDNVLQIHALNVSQTDGDFLAVSELIVGVRVVDLDQSRYFIDPSPGELNGLGAIKLGPLITKVEHTPHAPHDFQPIVVTATIGRTFADRAGAGQRFDPLITRHDSDCSAGKSPDRIRKSRVQPRQQESRPGVYRAHQP